MEHKIDILESIPKSKEGLYYLLPFEVPKDIERLDISYYYPRKIELEKDGYSSEQEINIIDLALEGPNGEYLGSSGSDRSHIFISSARSAQGYAKSPIKAGTWNIIVGAYKIYDDGVDVQYSIELTPKKRRLLKGDTHVHTLGSDGCMTVADTVLTAKKMGLDYIFITDHNNFAHNFYTPDVDGIVIMPGTEWTHYKGHCGMLGVKKPFNSAFCVNSVEEAIAKTEEAKDNGAVLVINHPLCPKCGWKWGFDGFKYDALEIWNGGVPMSVNFECIDRWHKMLCAGNKISIIGGSDFHRFKFNRSIGTPTTCLYAYSSEPEDILKALKNGNGYITICPDAPSVYAEANGKILGESALSETDVDVSFLNVKQGDSIRLISDKETQEIIVNSDASEMKFRLQSKNNVFYRFEVYRHYEGFINPQLILISNPLYFCKKGLNVNL